MHAGGFLDRNVTTSPSRLAIVLALHGAALAALMLAKPEYVPKIDWKALDTYVVDEKPVPPPEAIPEPPKAQPFDKPVETVPPLVDPGAQSNENQVAALPPVTPAYTPPYTPPVSAPVTTEATMLRGIEVQPAYPMALARQEIEGVAIVRVLIGTDGRVKDVQMISASEPEFFEATARQAKRYWKFKPATRDGVAIESWRQMTVRFKLEA